jgi:hypothetical protein
MWPYWMLFSLAAFGAVTTVNRQAPTTRRVSVGPWVVAYLVLVLLIGLRYRVGGDWESYLYHLDDLQGASLQEAVGFGDPAYQLISWLFADWSAGIYLVNTICAVIFCYGLMTFCRSLPRPWLALAAAIPYLVIVVAMGYTRQSVALGCWMVGLVALQRGSWMKFTAWVLLGALFHKSAVILLPLPIILARRHRVLTAMAVLGIFALSYLALLQESMDDFYAGYIEAEYQSEGAYVRLLMCVVPAVILLLTWKRLRISPPEVRLWRWLATMALILLGVLFVSPSSTAVDRVALYLLPLQLFVFSHLPNLLRGGSRLAVVAAVLLYYSVVQFVWLNYASHAIVWLPYRIYLGDALA